MEQVAGNLRHGGRWHALALLHAAKGQPDAALQIWKVRTDAVQGV